MRGTARRAASSQQREIRQKEETKTNSNSKPPQSKLERQTFVDVDGVVVSWHLNPNLEVKVHQLAELRFGVCWLKFAAPAPAPAVARGQNELLKKKRSSHGLLPSKRKRKDFSRNHHVRACVRAVWSCVRASGKEVVCAREKHNNKQNKEQQHQPRTTVENCDFSSWAARRRRKRYTQFRSHHAVRVCWRFCRDQVHALRYRSDRVHGASRGAR